MAEDMAEAESKENPFSFKTFVKTKQDTTSTKANKAQSKQKSKDSAVNLCNKNHFKDEAPFPEVDKEGMTNDKLNCIAPLCIEGFTVADVILVVGQTRQNLQ